MKIIKETNVNVPIKQALIISMLCNILTIIGCKQDTPAERSVKNADKVYSQAEDNIEKADKTAQQQIEAQKEVIKDKAEKSKDQIDQSTENAKEILENKEVQIEKNTDNAKEKLERNRERNQQIMDPKDSGQREQTAGSYLDDTAITLKVKTAFADEPLLKGSDISVTSKNGVVDLSGTVETELAISKATELAKIQENVKAVTNNIKVKPVMPAQ